MILFTSGIKNEKLFQTNVNIIKNFVEHLNRFHKFYYLKKNKKIKNLSPCISLWNLNEEENVKGIILFNVYDFYREKFLMYHKKIRKKILKEKGYHLIKGK